ncbi:hypothetical protein Goklo_008385 [Gossypium klotzschianum]|uniref:Uncharacterized protein n=1 Tax=Gossypium klotzschianum TaxID=34286 RepID=A0A7J8V0H3_9ROSI|nr:hypothetical protein [Gossypium klotzschianum]
MLILVEKLTKLYSKLENHRQQSEADVLSAALRAFRYDVSNCLEFKTWIRNLVLLMDSTIFHLLELLKSVSSSLSHLTHARLSFALALTLLQNSPSLAIKHLKAIQPQGSSKDYRGQQDREDGDKYSNFNSFPWKEKLAKPYLEIKQLIATSNSASLNLVDSCISDVMVEKGEILREVKELNNAAASLASAIVSGKSSDAAKDLETRLGVFGKQQEALEKQVHYLFSKVFAARKELLLSVRQCRK